MSSPYKILGIEPSATDEEVKAAYRNLAKKYHPDNYTNSPLADLAEEKMKEINEAYSTIMKRRQQKKNNANQNNEDYSYDESYSDPELERVRMKIDERDYIGAEALLNEIGRDENKRSSEWYFLMGTIYEKRGWYFEAYKMFSTASKMDPNNPKYQYAMQRMQGKRTDNNGDDMRQFGRTATSCCSTLLCTDCCCECFGGDLIKCC